MRTIIEDDLVEDGLLTQILTRARMGLHGMDSAEESVEDSVAGAYPVAV